MIEAPVEELEATAARTQQHMANASAIVLRGFRLRSDAQTIRYPDRYQDPRGAEMWTIVTELLTNARHQSRLCTVQGTVRKYVVMRSAEHFRLRSLDRVVQSVARIPRPIRGERFLSGPIPWPWIMKAARLPGRALHVGLAIWLHARMRRTGEIRLSIAPLQAELGVSRTAAYRALQRLEQAHLLAVVRHRGRKPIVSLLDYHVVDANEQKHEWQHHT